MLTRLIAYYVNFAIFKVGGLVCSKEITPQEYVELSKKRDHKKSLFLFNLEAFFFAHFAPIVFKISDSANETLRKILATITFPFFSHLRKIIDRNLEIAFKDRFVGKEKKKLVKKTFLTSVDSLGWFIQIPNLTADKISSQAKVIGYEHVEKAMKRGKGLICCSPHFSRFMYPVLYLSLLKKQPVNFIIRKNDNPWVNQAVNRSLEYKHIHVLERNLSSLKKSIKVLKANQILYLMMDENVAVGGVFVPFFKILASSFRGVHFLKEKTDCSILCSYVNYDKNQNPPYAIHFSPLLEDHSSEYDLIFNIHNYYEKVISEQPEKYLWMLPRWKKRPQGEPNLYPGIFH